MSLKLQTTLKRSDRDRYMKVLEVVKMSDYKFVSEAVMARVASEEEKIKLGTIRPTSSPRPSEGVEGLEVKNRKVNGRAIFPDQ